MAGEDKPGDGKQQAVLGGLQDEGGFGGNQLGGERWSGRAGDHVEIEAYRAIGFIHAGQSVVVKVDSFPFTLYGSLDGEVVRVGRDALPEQDARNAEAIGTQGTKPAMFATAERM